MTYSAAPLSAHAFCTASFTCGTFRTGIWRLALRRGFFPALLLAVALILAGATPSAFAQHGGGGGGVGHAGGGGGGHSGGGSATSAHVSSPSHTSSAKPSIAPPTIRHAPSRPNDANHSSGLNRVGTVGSVSAQFEGAAGGGSGLLSTARESFTTPRNVTIGFPPLTERTNAAPLTISSLALGQHMSLYGDGGEVWQEPSRPQTGQAFSQQHLARQVSTNAPATSEVLRTAHAALPTQSSGLTVKPRTSAVISEGPIFPRHPRYPIFGGNGFGGRGFDPWFLGLGWGLEGLGGCDPTWAFGCNAFADPSPGYGWDANADSNQMDDSLGAQPLGDQIENVWQDPPTDSASMADEIAAEKSLVVLYLNDGSVYALTNYWVAGGKLHYETSYGADNSLDLGELDLQRTVNANAARGVEFTLRPAPEPKKAAPEPSQAPQTHP